MYAKIHTEYYICKTQYTDQQTLQSGSSGFYDNIVNNRLIVQCIYIIVHQRACRRKKKVDHTNIMGTKLWTCLAAPYARTSKCVHADDCAVVSTICWVWVRGWWYRRCGLVLHVYLPQQKTQVFGVRNEGVPRHFSLGLRGTCVLQTDRFGESHVAS